MESEGVYNNFAVLIDEYEDIIKTLTDQVDNYKEDHESLKQEINKLIKENGELTKRLNEILENPETLVKDIQTTFNENDLIANLKLQLEYAIQEKEYVSELWQTALRNNDHLEEELKLFEGRSHGYVSKAEVNHMKKKYDSHIKELQLELVNSQKSLQAIIKTSRATITAKSFDLQEALQEQKGLFEFVKKLERDLSELQNQQKEINNLKDKLSKSLKEKDTLNEQLQKKVSDSKCKISEAVTLVEAALMEKDAALLREQNAKEEISKMSKIMAEMVEETEEKVKNEAELLKTKYDIKLKKYEMELSSKNEELKVRTQEVEYYKKECKLLEEQVNRLQKGNISLDGSNTSKLLILEKNLEATFQKLLTSEKKLLQVTSEKDSLKDDLDQMAKHYEQDVKGRELEKRTLQQKIKKLQGELERGNVNLVKFAEKVQELNEKIASMDNDVKTKLNLKEESQKVLSERIQVIQQMNTRIQSELEARLEKQVDINKKWKAEFRNITEKMEVRLKELKSESNSLKKVNKDLSTRLREAEIKASDYKVHLENLCSEVNMVARGEGEAP